MDRKSFCQLIQGGTIGLALLGSHVQLFWCENAGTRVHADREVILQDHICLVVVSNHIYMCVLMYIYIIIRLYICDYIYNIIYVYCIYENKHINKCQPTKTKIFRTKCQTRKKTTTHRTTLMTTAFRNAPENPVGKIRGIPRLFLMDTVSIAANAADVASTIVTMVAELSVDCKPRKNKTIRGGWEKRCQCH